MGLIAHRDEMKYKILLLKHVSRPQKETMTWPKDPVSQAPEAPDKHHLSWDLGSLKVQGHCVLKSPTMIPCQRKTQLGVETALGNL